MKDYCLRAMGADGQIRAFVATSRELANEAARIHGTSAVAAAALGRALTAAAIMGLTLGNDENSMTLSIKGDGPLGGILAVGDGLGRVKGYVNNPGAEVAARPDGKLDVGAAVGAGQLTVAMDLGLKEAYVGAVELISGEIAEDLAHYYLASEQTPSIISLGVLVDTDLSVKQAGGFFLQLLPGHSPEIIDRLEAQIADFPPISQLLEQGKTPEQVLELLLAPFGYEITEKSPIGFYCNCNRKRVERVLISLGAEEIAQLSTEEDIEINCHFCNRDYKFSKGDLEAILRACV
ncbi:MAG: Hsp33 family molecular chaperone HslO [Clostridiales bacterium]|nr:Hsp33 family molecular chaperone HslO [Clostridiales bacterium]